MPSNAILSRRSVRTFKALSLLACTLLVARAPRANAQAAVALSDTHALLVLPDAPGANAPAEGSSSSSTEATSSYAEDVPRVQGTASVRAAVILPGQTAPRLTVSDKIAQGIISNASVYSAAGWILAAGYTHATNGPPNYGTDSGAFGERLGAAALRGYSEGVIGSSILAPLLHEDPRYYKMGTGHPFFTRLTYSATRIFITRNDNGSEGPNLSLIGGNLAGSALTNAYYPNLNRSASQTMITFGSSLGGSALGNLVSEFIPNDILSKTLVAVHLRRR